MSYRKEYWPIISARISPEDARKLRTKHPNKSEITKVLRALISKYVEGRILGLKIEN